MKCVKSIFLLVTAGLLTINVEAVEDTSASHTNLVSKEISIIPRPNKMKASHGEFLFTTETRILYTGEGARSIADYLSERLSVPMGLQLDAKILTEGADIKGHIVIQLSGKTAENSEQYELLASPAGIVLKAPSRKGLFYATQSLLQLLPVELFAEKIPEDVTWGIPAVEIEDAPVLPWRGFMLDVARHFFSKETILRQIDLLALYKINRFHLHLTDDQGWRVQIKKYPKLTQVGAWQILDDGRKQGGFYTQQELREIVEYAKEREVMIIPEIDMPGHSLAAIAAYPELSCRGVPVAVRIGAGVSSDNMCPSNEKVYEFIGDVFDELIEIFPDPYIHIGADEASKGYWLKCPRCTAKAGVKINPSDQADREKIFSLQADFVRRVNAMIRERGKTMIGWDEIADHDGLKDLPGAIVQSWRSSSPGLMAAANRHKVILSPATTFYLDYPNGRRPTDRIYGAPIPDRYWKGHFIADNILGVECALWTESVSNQFNIDYLSWPRLMAMAEVGWTEFDLRSYRDFTARRKAHEKRLDFLGVRYQKIDGQKLACLWRPEDMPEDEVVEYDITGVLDQSGKWEFIFVFEGANGLTTKEFEIVQNGEVICRSNRQQTMGWRDTWPVVEVPVKNFDPDAKQTLRIELRRNPKDQGKNLNSMGSVWVNFLEET